MRWPLAASLVAGLASLAVDRVYTAAAPENVLRQLVVEAETGRVVIRLRATHDLAGTLKAIDAPSRVFVDLAGVRPDVSRSTAVGLGAVRQIRVALNQAHPLVTRVVVDLSQSAPYQLERGTSPRELRLVIRSGREGPAAGPSAAYAGWFQPTLDVVGRLLDQTSKLTLDSPAGQTESVRRDWERALQSIHAQTPPAERRVDHALLLEAARLGRIAAHNRSDATRLLADALAGEAGARLLLVQAQSAMASVGPERR